MIEVDKSFLEKCKEDKRLRSLMTLIIWVVVLAVLIGGMYIISLFNNTIPNSKNSENKINEEKKNNNNTPEILSYTEKLSKLVDSDYEFSYLITKGNEKIKFDGTKTSLVIEGYKQDSNGIIKYKIEKNKTYQILIDKVVEISNLYENIDSSLLDLNYVVGLLNNEPEDDIIITEEELITTYSYNLTKDEEELEITVIENNDAIEEINIRRSNETYTLMYEIIEEA